MKVKLTKRIITRTFERKTIELKKGTEVYYYGNDYSLEEYPVTGEVMDNDGVLYIEWEDNQDPTMIEDTDRFYSIINLCGF